MSLINFGSILGFAEEIERQNMTFFAQASVNQACVQDNAMFQSMEKSAKKRVGEVLRIRRENVSEMILETFAELQRDPFIVATEDASTLEPDLVIDRAHDLLARSVEYYEKAATKLKGQADVAMALKNLAKKHKKEQNKLTAYCL
ncbi:MAG: hypothetical protein COA36_07405 [Desulfotalea sp.]|nr:MAG: hypothetical protein COA36_07405 [Desulfotalea sp.]